MFLSQSLAGKTRTLEQPARAGSDPHTDGAFVQEVRNMADAFLAMDGSLVDVCAGDPCRTVPAGA